MHEWCVAGLAELCHVLVDAYLFQVFSCSYQTSLVVFSDEYLRGRRFGQFVSHSLDRATELALLFGLEELLQFVIVLSAEVFGSGLCQLGNEVVLYVFCIHGLVVFEGFAKGGSEFGY